MMSECINFYVKRHYQSHDNHILIPSCAIQVHAVHRQLQGQHIFGTWRDLENKVRPVVHPDFYEATVVTVNSLSGTVWELMGGDFSEHMPNVTARVNKQSAPAHPNLEKYKGKYLCERP